MNLKINTIPQINYHRFENRNLKSSQIQQREQNTELKSIGYTDLVFKGNVKSIPIESISPLVDGLVSRMRFIFNIPSSKSSGAVTNMKSAFKMIHNNKPHIININAIKSNKNPKTTVEYKINITEEGKSKGTDINMTISSLGHMTAGTFSDQKYGKIIFSKTRADKQISYKNLEYKYNDIAQKCELINPTNQIKTALKELEVNDIFKFFLEMTKKGISISK